MYRVRSIYDVIKEWFPVYTEASSWVEGVTSFLVVIALGRPFRREFIFIGDHPFIFDIDSIKVHHHLKKRITVTLK